jgi:hypothetical protein
MGAQPRPNGQSELGGHMRAPSSPRVFVVGAPRSGTTFLTQVLSAHPNLLIHTELQVLVLAGIAGRLACLGVSAGWGLEEARHLLVGRIYVNHLLAHLQEKKRGISDG